MTTINDIHSRLNETDVARIVPVASVQAIRNALATARAEGLPVSVAGGRHAMGGQQFCSGGVLLDTSPLDRVLDFDRTEGTIEVEAGIQWPALFRYLERSPWAVAQKQTGADRPRPRPYDGAVRLRHRVTRRRRRGRAGPPVQPNR
jgi:hypothetical protein